jgi:hypothetical protein
MTTKETEMTRTSKETKNRGTWQPGLRAVLSVGVLALGGLLVGCGGGSPPPAQCNVAPAVGATWTIDKQLTGAVLTCDQAAATTVELTINNTPFDFDCNAGQGLTTELTPGSYSADFALLGPDANGNLQVLSQTQTMTIHVASCGVTDLGDVVLDVN